MYSVKFFIDYFFHIIWFKDTIGYLRLCAKFLFPIWYLIYWGIKRKFVFNVLRNLLNHSFIFSLSVCKSPFKFLKFVKLSWWRSFDLCCFLHFLWRMIGYSGPILLTLFSWNYFIFNDVRENIVVGVNTVIYI